MGHPKLGWDPMKEEVDMGAETISIKLREIFASELGLDHSDIADDLQYNMIPEWDSVGHMHLVAAIEEEFSIEIPDNDVAEMTVFSKIVVTVLQLLNRG